MSNQELEIGFAILGLIVVLLLCIRMRRLSERARGAAATAAFGLFLSARYSALIHGAANWMFTIGVGLLMALLAYNNLDFRGEPKIEQR